MEMAKITIQSCSPNELERQCYYFGQIIKYAKKHDYYFNRNFPKGWLTFRVDLAESKRYQLCITVHHYGYDDSTLAIGAFLEFLTPHHSDERSDERIDDALPLEIKPHVISITGDVTTKKKKHSSLYTKYYNIDYGSNCKRIINEMPTLDKMNALTFFVETSMLDRKG